MKKKCVNMMNYKKKLKKDRIKLLKKYPQDFDQKNLEHE